MFMPVSMCKVRLIGPKSAMKATIDALEAYGGTEIKKFAAKEMEVPEPFEELETLSEKILHLDALLSILQEKNGRKLGREQAESYFNSSEFAGVSQSITEASKRLGVISAEKESIKDELQRLRVFSRFGIDFGKLEAETILVIAGMVQNKNRNSVLGTLGETLDSSFVEKPASKHASIMLVAIPKSDYGAVEKLSKAGFERMTIPAMKGTAMERIAEAEAEAKKLDSQKKGLEKGLERISESHYHRIAAAREMLSLEAKKAGMPHMMSVTESVFVAEAFLPEKNYSGFETFAQKTLGEKIVVKKFSSRELAARHEETPTLLEHPKALSTFEFMTKFVSVPKSREIDPTMVFTVFFPIFYGMMVGDAVYGIISFFIANFIHKKAGADSILKPVSQLWMWSAIPTILFGVIYDEYAGMPNEKVLGLLGLHGTGIYHGLERLHNVETILLASILFGVFTMAFGFLLGFYNASLHGNRKHQAAKLGWFGIVTSGTVAVASGMFQAYPHEFFLPSMALFGVSLLMVILSEGPIAIMEVPSLVGNVFSFARILAVGLVGAVIALILNEFAMPSADAGLLLILLIPLFIAGHLFNAVFAMFESLIQGARLNYVEFYSKFYEGGGWEFSPLRVAGKYLKNTEKEV